MGHATDLAWQPAGLPKLSYAWLNSSLLWLQRLQIKPSGKNVTAAYVITAEMWGHNKGVFVGALHHPKNLERGRALFVTLQH
jgi:hypothetical protein